LRSGSIEGIDRELAPLLKTVFGNRKKSGDPLARVICADADDEKDKDAQRLGQPGGSA
jgi:hypothetical protein